MTKKKTKKKAVKKPAKKKPVKKKAKIPLDTSVALELEGKVFITETNNKTGKVVSREELDGMIVLRTLLNAVEDSLRALGKEVK